MDITTTFQHDTVAVQTDTELHLLIELTAPTAAPSAERRPMRLALALDRSGSMAGPRLDAARSAAAFLVDQLHDDDQLALVTYESEVRLEVPLRPLDRPAIQQAIAGIGSGGMTNLSGGWLKAAEELQRDSDATGVRRVLLLSDGHANQGITASGQLGSLAASLAGQGVATTTIGFGEGFDEELMGLIADNGRGSSHYAATVEDLPGIFADEFDDLVSLVAQNVSVELQLSNEVKLVEVLNTHAVVGVPGGVQIQVGDAYAGATTRLVVKLHIPALASLGLATVGEVVLRWVGVGDQVAAHKVTSTMVVSAVSADDAATATDHPDVVEETTILLAGRRTAEARRLAEEGRHGEASALARQTVDELRAFRGDHPAAAALAETADRLEQTAASLADNQYSAMESKELYFRSRDLTKRRRDHRDDRDDRDQG